MDNVNKDMHSTRTTSKEQYSPVSKLSPAKQTQGKNLTGPARHIRDLTADIHAGIQQWNALHLRGITLLHEISRNKENDLYSQHLQELCDELEIVCDALDDVVTNFAETTHQIKITTLLDRSTDKLFATWHSTQFGQVAESIYDAYFQETKVKRKVLEHVAHSSMESWKMLFLATWVHQPLLPERLTTMLESMLVETGHR